MTRFSNDQKPTPSDKDAVRLLRTIKQRNRERFDQLTTFLRDRYGLETFSQWLILTFEPEVLEDEPDKEWMCDIIFAKQGGWEWFQSGRTATLIRDLMDKGFVMGEDFSRDSDGGFIMSPEVTAYLKTTVSPEIWDEVQKNGWISSERPDPWAAVEARLEVPFRLNLLDRLSELVEQGRSSHVIASWTGLVSCGVSSQVAGDASDSHLFALMCAYLKDNHSAMFTDFWDTFNDDDTVLDGKQLLELDINPIEDVVRAAGSSEENGELSVIDGRGCMSRAALQRLSLVWRGDRMSANELIAAFDKESR